MDETALPVPTPDGRLVMAAAFGPHDGQPVLSLHATPGSRLFSVWQAGLLERTQVRLVTFDRPGYGGSARRAGRSVADVVDDAVVVADALSLQRFAVLGFGGGGPHALALATALGDRISRCALLSSPAPLDAGGLDFFAGMSAGSAEEFDAALAGQTALEAAITPMASAVTEDVYAFLAALAADLPEVDRTALARPGLDRLLADSITEAVRGGADGWIDDDLAFARPWGFDPGRARVPVALWHGAEDTSVPVSHSAWLGRAVPRAIAHVLVGCGHLGTLDRLEEVLRWLLD
jgi:pimeloyl-ACP methyl ester carboxylesterase